jgi:hypothetical protein
LSPIPSAEEFAAMRAEREIKAKGLE